MYSVTIYVKMILDTQYVDNYTENIKTVTTGLGIWSAFSFEITAIVLACIPVYEQYFDGQLKAAL